ncbi:acetate/propionate family kinase [Cobetia amphilecti]|jgi:acetate kinase|uniref:Acetate kinase n=1 Tax=Cobetia amphilecti TaxID=1055104 RepID=A0ABT6UQM6_9GAMM|nr:acetate/propionate family kinase [Cobetia amphilecti]MBR9799257.1 acetate/propionate family kinase [Gammaproteobacteria bacterium]MDI5885008.1 acetate/propionate family kinase [Cobetia amphilecti]WOI24823.1 acetate/propionate family kinase [Cobetia amphilecti]HAR07187.1 acetate kinase [Cobetia sp.]|tara:strand:- start:107 stop:1336 length:1230 start_codon:yes stop_codon:yes gene_type:complete
MTDVTLVLNAGSSSIKFALFPAVEGVQEPVLRGKLSGIGSHPRFTAQTRDGTTPNWDAQLPLHPRASHEDLIPALFDWLERHDDGLTITAAGHRVVHGGREHHGPARVCPTLLDDLAELIPLAPNHQPHSLVAIQCLVDAVPRLPQVVCFDTSFHRTQDSMAQTFALPRALSESGIVRYGFHGLSYQYIADRLPETPLGTRSEGRVIVAHLGNGASLCAMRQRRSVATSMGFTALEGLMMGQRCGSLDPGVLLHLLDGKGMSTTELRHLLYEESGLLGVSGISNDMAELEAHPAPEAREAIEMFCYRAACEMTSLATALGGLDSIVFTAGIGENSALVRHLIIQRLAWLGATLDTDANQRNATSITGKDSALEILVIPTDEEGIIASETRRLLSVQPTSSHRTIQQSRP